MRVVVTILLGVCAALPASATAADWPTCAHDNRRSAVTAERLAPPLRLRWVFRPAFPPAKGWARPVNGYGATKNASNASFDDACHVVAVGDRAYFASSGEDLIYSADAATGRVRWTFHTSAPPRLAPTVWRGKVYFGSDGGTAWCLRADDGAVVWKHRGAPTDEKMLGTGRLVSLWPMRTGVMVEAGVAYFTVGLFPSEGIYLFAVDAATGRLIWRRQLDSGGLGCPSPQGYLLASGDSLYITSRTAPTRWRLVDGAPRQFATPLPRHEYRFHNGGSYAQLWNGKIVYGQAAILGYDPDKVLIDKYKRELKGALVFNWFNARRIAFSDKYAYVATDYHLLGVKHSHLAELSAGVCRNFEQAYREYRVADYLTALEALAEHGEGSPVGRRLKETSLKWGRERFEAWPAEAEKLFARFAAQCEWMLPVKATEAMAIAGDVLYAGGEEFVVAVDARTGTELWRDRTRSRVRGLAVANGRLLVSTIDGAVRCYAAEAAEEQPVEIRFSAAASQPETGAPAGELTRVVADMAGRMGPRKGYALVCAGDARLARAIARHTKLSVHVLEPDAARVAGMRRELAAAGLYGGRVTVEHAEPGALALPPYVFNVVVEAAPRDPSLWRRGLSGPAARRPRGARAPGGRDELDAQLRHRRQYVLQRGRAGPRAVRHPVVRPARSARPHRPPRHAAGAARGGRTDVPDRLPPRDVLRRLQWRAPLAAHHARRRSHGAADRHFQPGRRPRWAVPGRRRPPVPATGRGHGANAADLHAAASGGCEADLLGLDRQGGRAAVRQPGAGR